MKPAARLLAILALVATALWAAFPGVVVAAVNPASGQEEPCPCCDDRAALAGVVACPACQVGTLPGRSPAVATVAVTTPWLAIAPAPVLGIDPAPAEPPPR
jgi:hypothetical protein